MMPGTIKESMQLRPDVGDSLYARFFSGLADETRMRIVRYLLDGPKTVGEIVQTLSMSQSRVSNHLSCLKWCGYVHSERKGRNVLYRLADPSIADIVALAQGIVSRNAAHIAQCTQLASET